MPLADFAFYALLAVSLIAVFIAQGTLVAAREHVRVIYPDWYARLAAGGYAMRLGGPNERVRRRLVVPLLLGKLPAEAASDVTLARIVTGLRLSMGVLAAAFGGVLIAIAQRAAA